MKLLKGRTDDLKPLEFTEFVTDFEVNETQGSSPAPLRHEHASRFHRSK